MFEKKNLQAAGTAEEKGFTPRDCGCEPFANLFDALLADLESLPLMEPLMELKKLLLPSAISEDVRLGFASRPRREECLFEEK